MNYQERPCESQPGDIINSIKRYESVAMMCKGKRVLDFSCGYGYGTNVLHSAGIDVVGVERDAAVIEQAIKKFPICKFMVAEAFAIDLTQFDIIVSMEVIEHLEFDDRDTILKLFSSKVKETIMSTPNGDMFPYKPRTKEQRVGYHVCHYTYVELDEIFRRFYSNVAIFGQAFDPRIGKYTGHFVYASNAYIFS